MLFNNEEVKPLIGKITAKYYVTYPDKKSLKGKKFIAAKKFTVESLKHEPFTYALKNFKEQVDINSLDPNTCVYYGHTDGFGYFILEKDLKHLRPATRDEIMKIW